jgi:hypothetical protein
VVFENITLSNAYPAKRHGIEVEGAARIVLRNALVLGSQTYGLVLRDASRAEITSTTIADTKLGVKVEDECEAMFHESTVKNAKLEVTGSATVTAEICDLSGNIVTVSASSSLSVADSILDRCDVSVFVNGAAAFERCQFRYLTGAIRALGSARLQLTDCKISNCQPAGFDHATGLQVLESASADVRRCTFADNAQTAIQVWKDASLKLYDSTIVRSGELGVFTYSLECVRMIVPSIGDSYSTADEFAGNVSGSGNTIPGPGEPDGNRLGDVCPSSLRFLKGG